MLSAMQQLGELLEQAGLVTAAQLQHAQDEQQRSGGSLGRVLVDLGIISERDLVASLALQIGMTFVDVDRIEVPSDVRDLLPLSLMSRHTVVPIGREGDQLTVAMADPSNVFALDDIRGLTRLSVHPVVATKSAIQTVLARWGRNPAPLPPARRAIPLPADQVDRFVEHLLERAVQDGARRIEVTQLEDCVVVSFVIGHRTVEILRSPTAIPDPAVHGLIGLANAATGDVFYARDDARWVLRSAESVWGPGASLAYFGHEPHLVGVPSSDVDRPDVAERSAANPELVTSTSGPDLAAPEATPDPFGGITILGSASTLESEALAVAARELPYPVARAARTLQRAAPGREQYAAMIRTADVLAVTLGVFGVGLIRHVGDPLPAELTEALPRGLSMGHWVKVLGASGRSALEREPQPTGLAAALRPDKRSGLLPALEALTQERNRWAHGGGAQTDGEAEALVSQLLPTLEIALRRSMFMVDNPWFLIDRMSYRRASNDFEVRAQRAMGDHPDFETRRLEVKAPLAEDTFYCITALGAVDLTPLLVRRTCPKCGTPEYFYADKIETRRGKSEVRLKSFETGHSHSTGDYGDDVSRLVPA